MTHSYRPGRLVTLYAALATAGLTGVAVAALILWRAFR